MSGIFDWYLLLVPLFVVFILLTLLTIKLSITKRKLPDIETLSKAKEQKAQKEANADESIFSTSPVFRTYAFFIKNHSFLEFCLVGKAKNKLPILLAIAVISGFCFLAPNMFVYSLLGIPIVIAFVLAESFFEVDPVDPLAGQEFNLQAVKQSALQQQKMSQRNQTLYIIFGSLACGLALLICGLTYRNYANSVLSALFVNIVVNSLMDIFVMRPIGFLIISFPLKFNLRIQIHIQHQNLRQQFVNISTSIGIKECATNLSPRKKAGGSPTKVPKAGINQNENESVNLENFKKVKREKKGSLDFRSPLFSANRVDSSGIQLQEYSLNNFLDQEKRLVQTPINTYKFDCNQDSSCKDSGVKTLRKDSQLVIVEFRDRDRGEQKSDKNAAEDEENMENIVCQNLDLQKITKKDINEDNQLNLIKIYKNEGENTSDDQDARRNRRNSFMTIQNGKKLNEIQEQEQMERQIQQIDLNSPSKRKNKFNKFNEETEIGEFKKSRKAKHFKSSANQRVIKYTSGEPYLQYLPKMLDKEHNKNSKKSQPICYKNDLENYEEKPRKSLKKVKGIREPKILFGDENACPEAMYVEDL